MVGFVGTTSLLVGFRCLKEYLIGFLIEIGEGNAKASGTLTIVRGDYLLGIGPSAAFVEIGPDVAVRFDLTARKTN